MDKANETIIVTGISNREFLELYAHPGRIGLSGGITLIDKAIARAERHLDESGQWGSWSHSFLFQGKRHDGHHWVIESDLQVNRKHIRLGVQENRISKFYDEKLYSTLAVLDFGLAEETVTTLLREGLELVAGRARYSLRELVGTYIALHDPQDAGNGQPDGAAKFHVLFRIRAASVRESGHRSRAGRAWKKHNAGRHFPDDSAARDVSVATGSSAQPVRRPKDEIARACAGTDRENQGSAEEKNVLIYHDAQSRRHR